MQIKGYNRNSPDEIHQPSTYVNQPSTSSDISIHPQMTSQERDKQLDILLNEDKKIQNNIVLDDAEAKTNSKAIEHNENETRKLQKQIGQEGVFSHAYNIFGFGPIPPINEKIGYLQSERAKRELHDQKLFEKVRKSVLEREAIIRRKREINRKYMASGIDNTDSNRLSLINANYFKICKFIETHVTNFTLKEPFSINEPYKFALMHAVANKVSIKYFRDIRYKEQPKRYKEQPKRYKEQPKRYKEQPKRYKEPTDALYKNEIEDYMLIATFNEMEIFQSEADFMAFLEKARTDEETKQREKDELSRQQLDAHYKALSFRTNLSLVHPDECERKKRKRDDEVEVKVEDEDNKSKSRKNENPKKRGSGRRTRRRRSTRKSKK